MLDRVLKTIESRRDHALASLKEFLRIASISAKPEHKADMVRCAAWLADQLKFAGLEVAVMPTGGHPAVVARNRHQKGRPTILLYGHYDVQPPEPLDLWTTPAFEPTVRKDEFGYDAIFARGAADDKGQVWCHVEAILAWQANGGLPVNLTVLIEGEEEVGWDNLENFIRNHRDLLKADVCVISDTSQYDRGMPAISYALRGMVYEEIYITGPGHDLHSGGWGGAVPNPANVLCQVLATLHDGDGRVNVPGFYDDVLPLSERERQLWKKLPSDDESFAAELRIPFVSGEKGYSTLERIWARPTLDINGLTAGYQGHGSKTVIPSLASAKLSMRLVPNQDPRKIRDSFEQAIRDRLPGNVQVRFETHGLSPASILPIDNPATQLAAEALTEGFGVEPSFIRSGGSIPVVGIVKRELGLDTLLVGFGLPDDRAHSPNEKFDIGAFHCGMRTAAVLYEKLAKLNG